MCIYVICDELICYIVCDDPIPYVQGGFTPLWIAAHQGHSEVVQELLSSKADLDYQDQVSVRACYEGENLQSSLGSQKTPQQCSV